MLVYVAAKLEEAPRVRALYEKLRAAGHEITLDWTVAEASADIAASGEALFAFLREWAHRDLIGVIRAEALVILPNEKSKGAYTELGIALGRNKPVIAVGDYQTAPNCIFLHDECVQWVAADDDVVRALDDVTPSVTPERVIDVFTKACSMAFEYLGDEDFHKLSPGVLARARVHAALAAALDLAARLALDLAASRLGL